MELSILIAYVPQLMNMSLIRYGLTLHREKLNL